MKTIEEIEKEYEEYKIKSDFVTDLEGFQAFMIIGIDDTDESIADTLKEIKLNNRVKLETAIKNFFLAPFGMRTEDLCDEDNDILRKVAAYTASYREFFERILELADESNFKELLRLVDFSTEYYNEQMSYYESQRDALEYSAKGINFFNSKYSDEREVFQKFMDKKLSSYNPTKSVEKIKKI